MMREPQRLTRFYHDHLIVSVQSMEPHPDGDGWNHEVFVDKDGSSIDVFNSLGAAIQCAKRAKYPGKYPEQIESTETLEAVAVDYDGEIKPIDEILPLPEEPEPEETE